MVTRISGFSSGLDIDSLVKDLMKAHRIPVDKLVQKKTKVEWQRDAFREINTKLADYRNNKLYNFRFNSTFSPATITTTGNTAAVTATSGTDAQTGTLSVKAVKLAVASNVNSTSDLRKVDGDTTFDPSKTLAELYDTGKINATFTNVTDPTKYDKVQFTINSGSLEIDPNTTTFNDLVKKMNGNSAMGVTAFYDSYSGKMSIVSKTTGDGSITYSDTTGTLLGETLNLSGATVNPGDNAEAEINGILTERSSNTFTINGVNITLNTPSGTGADLSTYTATTISVTKDTSKIIENIKGFINDYNDVLKSLQDKVNEERYRDFLPLSEDQKKDMSESEIELWEKKAKSGLLRRDSILNKAISELRSSIITPMSGADPDYQILASIGIETGKYYEGGKLYLKDEAKLRTALENEPDKVIALLTGKGATDNSSGVAERMYNKLDDILDLFTEKAGTSAFSSTMELKAESTLGRKLTQMNRQIDRMNDRLIDLEDRYYRQFTAMETAMNRYNSQSSYLSSF